MNRNKTHKRKMGAESFLEKLMAIKRMDRQATDYDLCLQNISDKRACSKYAKRPKNAPRKSYPVKNPKYSRGHQR